MFRYYLWLGLKNLRRSPVLTALSVLLLAVGIGASMTSLTVLHVLSSDPMPGRSERLYVPQFNNWLQTDRMAADAPNPQMTWIDADRLLRDGLGTRRAALYGVSMTVRPPRPEVDPFYESGIASTRELFAMFGAPLASGSVWSADDDLRGSAVTVLSADFARRVFGSTDVVGRELQLQDRAYRVVGVLGDWQPLPKLYRLIGSPAADPVDAYWIPLRNAVAMELSNDGWVNCTGDNGPGWEAFLQAECNWLQYWVELAPDEVDAYRDYLRAYVAEQRAAGRMPRS